jgi:hypothetical protein
VTLEATLADSHLSLGSQMLAQNIAPTDGELPQYQRNTFLPNPLNILHLFVPEI